MKMEIKPWNMGDIWRYYDYDGDNWGYDDEDGDDIEDEDDGEYWWMLEGAVNDDITSFAVHMTDQLVFRDQT